MLEYVVYRKVSLFLKTEILKKIQSYNIIYNFSLKNNRAKFILDYYYNCILL